MVTITYNLVNELRAFPVELPTYNAFKMLYQEFVADNRYTNYDIFVYGGFASYLLRDPQWQTKDINIFIGRKKVLDTQDLHDMMILFLELAEKYKLKLDVKYFTEHETPFTLTWGTKVQYLTITNKTWQDGVVDLDLTKEAEVIDNGLFVVDSLYEMSGKDLTRINDNCKIFKGVNLKKHKF